MLRELVIGDNRPTAASFDRNGKRSSAARDARRALVDLI
jgi:hypothetical protein